MKFTTATLKKMEDLLSEVGYTIRYEKGNFNSGYCIVEQKKVAVINRFFDTAARCNSLMEMILSLPEDNFSEISEKSVDFYQKIKKNQATETS